MELTQITFDEGSILIKNVVDNIKKEIDIESCCKLIIDYQTSRKKNIDSCQNNEDIEMWWNHDWQASLDFYLSSSETKQELKFQNDESFYVKKQSDIFLSEECTVNSASIFKILKERKTYRKFNDSQMSNKNFSILMNELKKEISHDFWNFYIIVFNIQDIEPGIYFYEPRDHGLSIIKKGVFRLEMMALLCGMSASLSASLVIVMSINLDIAQKRYPYNRALREIYIESGRLAQKIILKGIENHIGSLPSPAMRDTNMCHFLNIDPMNLLPIYTITCGNISRDFNSK